jgi:DNA repair exonuclease SbcCD ATPase subunit
MAQLTPQELQELVKLYKILDGLTDSAAQNAAQQAQAIGNANNELTRLRKEYNDFTSDISSSLETFKELVSQISKQKTGIDDSRKAYKGLSSIAEKIQYHQQGISTLSSKELETLQKKAKQEGQRLINAQTTLENNKANLLAENARLQTIKMSASFGSKAAKEAKEQQNQNKLKLIDIDKTYQENKDLIDGTNNSLTQTVETLKEELKVQKEIEKSLGLTGALMKGISKIPFLGDLPGISDISKEVEEDIRKIQEDTGKTVSRTEALGMAFKKMLPIIKGALLDPLSIGLFLFKQFKDAFKAIDSGAGELAKNMNISYNEALSFREELSTIARQSDSIFVTTKALGETYSAISNSLGANVQISQQNLETFTKLKEQAGFTNDEIVSLNKLTVLTGKSAKEVSVSFLGAAKSLSIQKGLSINVKQLLKETANVSNTIKLSLGGSETALAKAMISAKGLGASLEKVDQIANSLLNFEESISAELEAELLTGKQLNLETARYAALTGDIATVAEEIKKQIGGSAEFGKMNRIQQEAFARAVGMSREELANTLVEQESLAKLGRALTDEEKSAYEFAKQKYGEEKAAQMLGENQLDNLMEQQSVQERFNQSIEKLKDIFVSIADGPIGTILSAFATLLSNTHILKGLLVGVGIALIPIAFKMASIAISAITAASASTLGIGIAAITAGIAVGLMSMTSASKKVQSATYIKDGIINPEGGLVVSGKKGTYSLDKNDTVIAGTNLNTPSDRPINNIQPLVDRLIAVENVLVQILNKNTNVYMDSTKVGTALNIGTVQIQ